MGMVGWDQTGAREVAPSRAPTIFERSLPHETLLRLQPLDGPDEPLLLVDPVRVPLGAGFPARHGVQPLRHILELGPEVVQVAGHRAASVSGVASGLTRP